MLASLVVFFKSARFSFPSIALSFESIKSIFFVISGFLLGIVLSPVGLIIFEIRDNFE